MLECTAKQPSRWVSSRHSLGRTAGVSWVRDPVARSAAPVDEQRWFVGADVVDKQHRGRCS
jgi:hypothetical protein